MFYSFMSVSNRKHGKIMNKYLLAITLLVGLGVQASSGNLMLNSDFSTDNTGGSGDAQIEYNALDLGWRFGLNSWFVDGTGAAVSGNTERGLGQVVSVGSETGADFTFSFDWTPGSGAAANELNLRYLVVGWDETGSPIAGNDFFANHNNNNLEGVALIETLDNKATAVNLLTGTTYTGGGAHGAGVETTAAGSAGLTLNYSTTFTLSGTFNDISELDYVGVLFYQDDAELGSTLDNVSLTVIPEPATLGLFAISGGALLFFRRKSMS